MADYFELKTKAIDGHKYQDIGKRDNLFDYEVIKQSIRNILSIPKGSMPDNPRFGTSIYKYMFDQLDEFTLDIMASTIETEILQQENRVDRITVHTDFLEEYNKLTLELHYYVKESEEQDFLAIAIQNQA